MTKENRLKKLDEQIAQISHEINAIREAKRYTEEKHSNAVYVVEKVPTNIYYDDWKREAEHLAKVLERLDQTAERLSQEQAEMCAEFEAIEQGKAEAETLTLKLDPISAQIVANTLEYYNLTQLEEAEKRDPFKDNGYLIKAIKDFLKAYEEATK